MPSKRRSDAPAADLAAHPGLAPASESRFATVAFTAREARNAITLFELAARAAAQTPGNDVRQIAEVAAVAAALTMKLQTALAPPA